MIRTDLTGHGARDYASIKGATIEARRYVRSVRSVEVLVLFAFLKTRRCAGSGQRWNGVGQSRIRR